MKTDKVATLTAAVAFVCLGVVIACECKWDKYTVKQENVTDCSNLGTNEIRMCEYRKYETEYEMCYQTTNVTHYNCISHMIDAPYYMVLNGTCQTDGLCTGGDTVGGWGTNRVYAVREFYRCCSY